MSYLKEAYPEAKQLSKNQETQVKARQIFLIAGAGFTEKKLENIVSSGDGRKASTVATVNLFENLFGENFHYLGVDTDAIGLSGSEWSIKNGAVQMSIDDARKSKRVMKVVNGIKKVVGDKETPIDIIGLSHGSVAGAQAIFLLLNDEYRVDLLIAAKSMIKSNNPLHQSLFLKGVDVLFSPNSKVFEDPVTESSGDSVEEAKKNWKKVLAKEASWVVHNKLRGVKERGHSGGAEDITHAGRMFVLYSNWLSRG